MRGNDRMVVQTRRNQSRQKTYRIDKGKKKGKRKSLDGCTDKEKSK